LKHSYSAIIPLACHLIEYVYQMICQKIIEVQLFSERAKRKKGWQTTKVRALGHLMKRSEMVVWGKVLNLEELGQQKRRHAV
jgi:hypothetical protein